MEKDSQELIIKLSSFEQQIKALQEQLQAVESAIIDAESINFGLNDFKNSKNKEVFAGLGKGIFIKTKIISEELVVDVGGKKFVKKSIADTQKLIEAQIKKLKEIKKDIENKLEEINSEITEIFEEAQKKSKN